MNSLRLAWTDIKRLSRSRFLRVALVAVSLMPLLYSFLYLYAFWDPYGRLDHLPVALVVQDKGATRDGKLENFGQQLADKLVAKGVPRGRCTLFLFCSAAGLG